MIEKSKIRKSIDCVFICLSIGMWIGLKVDRYVYIEREISMINIITIDIEKSQRQQQQQQQKQTKLIDLIFSRI